jgi:hypothetical protein
MRYEKNIGCTKRTNCIMTRDEERSHPDIRIAKSLGFSWLYMVVGGKEHREDPDWVCETRRRLAKRARKR